jgi:D-xylose transport system substrate-binding protein
MRYRQLIIAAAVALATGGVAACGSSDDNGSSGGGGSGGGGGEAKKIALLLPETKTTRYEAKDRPLFTAKVKALCPKCTILYSNASQDASKQQQQAEAAITNGADVLVLDAVDVKSVGAIIQHAN